MASLLKKSRAKFASTPHANHANMTLCVVPFFRVSDLPPRSLRANAAYASVRQRTPASASVRKRPRVLLEELDSPHDLLDLIQLHGWNTIHQETPCTICPVARRPTRWHFLSGDPPGLDRRARHRIVLLRRSTMLVVLMMMFFCRRITITYSESIVVIVYYCYYYEIV